MNWENIELAKNKNLDFSKISSFKLGQNTFFDNWILNSVTWVSIGILIAEFAWWHSKHAI